MIHGATIRRPDEKEFEEVKKYVEEFWLDNNNMLREQFRVLLYNNKLAAFGRLRKNADATELCTLGVVKKYRGRGFGKAMVKALLKEAKSEVYVVCVIPEFFKKTGFKEISSYPESIKAKVDLCTQYFHVGKEYKVMKYIPSR